MKSVDDTYLITNGSGEVLDPNGFVFDNQKDCRTYIDKNWTKKEQRSLGITIENLAEILGIQ
jgi:hypothetical protein